MVTTTIINIKIWGNKPFFINDRNSTETKKITIGVIKLMNATKSDMGLK